MNSKFSLIDFTELKKFLALITKKEKKSLIILFVFMIFSSLIETFSIGILIPLVNFLINPEASNNNLFSFFSNDSIIKININSILIIIFFVYLIKYLFLVFYNFFNAKVILSLNASIKKRLFKDYLENDYLFHLKNNSALLIRNVLTEVDVLIVNYLSPLLTFLLSFLTTTFIVLLLLYYSFISTIIIFLIFGLIGLCLNIFLRKKLKFIGQQRQIHALGLLQNLQQSFALIKEIKMLNKWHFFLDKFNFHNLKMVFFGVQRNVFGILPRVSFEYIFIILILISVFIINSIEASFQEFLTLLAVYGIASFRIIPALNNLSTSYQKIKFGIPALETIFEEFSKTTTKTKKIENEVKKMELKNEIEFKDIYFKYPNNNEFILENINFKFKKNSIIGIVGDNASGKSTLINLICGLLEPNKGNIFVDKNNIYQNIRGWQKIIGYIPQSIYLIDGSVETNIAFGEKNENRNLAKLSEVMNFTNLTETLGLNDLVGEGGKNISGGQKQKIAIARALYTDPEILIMDEVTSSLDLESEKEFIQRICNKDLGKTMIIVSHRVKALENCDEIFKLENRKLKKLDKS